MTIDASWMRDILVMCRVLAPGLVGAAFIGIATGWMRGRMPKLVSGRAEIAVVAIVVVLLGGLDIAALLGLVAIKGRAAFFLEALCLHLAIYLLAFSPTFMLARWLRHRGMRRAGSGTPD